MLKAKILFVGPCESGKTVLANFLTESSDITEYNPTQGVRILEFENPHVTSNNKGTGCEFELWDCGGDSKPKNLPRIGDFVSVNPARNVKQSAGEACGPHAKQRHSTLRTGDLTDLGTLCHNAQTVLSFCSF
ncbi:rab-like protein 5 [Cricetulus griseus]|uniref:Rab-like protein 5 n=1 Tax=Cricetulus griseus TaxID=10029 RepID=A0A061I5C7_CRIGR|nr:rab-like protein 5 [Cricetulus griseus]